MCNIQLIVFPNHCARPFPAHQTMSSVCWESFVVTVKKNVKHKMNSVCPCGSWVKQAKLATMMCWREIDHHRENSENVISRICRLLFKRMTLLAKLFYVLVLFFFFCQWQVLERLPKVNQQSRVGRGYVKIAETFFPQRPFNRLQLSLCTAAPSPNKKIGDMVPFRFKFFFSKML